jgi:methylglutaconyl-CoA hydratase
MNFWGRCVADELLIIDDTEASIRVFTLNRPQKRNALSIDLMTMLADAIDATHQLQKRVLILRGNGPVFCAGLDLQEARDQSNSEQSARALARVYLAIAKSPLITIASAQGGAFGGGVGLIAACDIAIASDDLRIGFPEVHRGLVASLITALLCRQLPQRLVRKLILLGSTIEADEALMIGLLQGVVPAENLLPATLRLARAACDGAPGAIARSKRLLDELTARPLEADIERALTDHLSARNSPEAREGIAAFLEKRKPIWPARDSE